MRSAICAAKARCHGYIRNEREEAKTAAERLETRGKDEERKLTLQRPSLWKTVERRSSTVVERRRGECCEIQERGRMYKRMVLR